MRAFFVDLQRYRVLLDSNRFFNILYLILFTPAIWVLFSYRLGRWVRNNLGIRILQIPLKIITLIFHFFNCVFTGIEIPFEAQIGEGFHISHYSGIVISPKAKIGKFCNIGPGVVIGEAGRQRPKKAPEIGDYVYMGAGAKILGGVNVKNNVAIGANSVVTKDVPENATVAGNPAVVINHKGSLDFIKI